MKFFNHLTFGQYVPSESPVHRLDPRCKIIAVLVLLTGIFLAKHPAVFSVWGVLLACLTAGARLPFRLVLRSAKPVLILVLFTASIHIFFTSGTPLVSLGEGETPLIPLKTLGEELGLRLFAKYEGTNPTGSFKDRGMVLAVAKALESLGAKRLFDSSQLPPERPIADVLAIRADAWPSRRAALRTLVRHIFAAQRHLMTLPVDAAYRLAPWLDVPHAAAMRTFSGLRLTNWADNREWLIGQPAPLQRAAEGLASFMGRVNILRPLRLPEDLVVGSALPAEEPR